MTQVAYPANGDVPPGTLYPTDGKRKEGTLFPFDTRGRVNGRANEKADTRRLQQIQKELRQLSLAELQSIRNDWNKPPINTMQWARQLVPYLDGLIKERTAKVAMLRKQREVPQVSKPITQSHLLFLIEDARREVLALRQEVNALSLRFKAASPSVEWTKKSLPLPRQHAKGKKRCMKGPVGELAAVTRPWLQYAVAHAGKEINVHLIDLKANIDMKRFQSSISATASYFYGRRSMTTRLLYDSSGIVSGVACTFHGATKDSACFASIDQSTPAD